MMHPLYVRQDDCQYVKEFHKDLSLFPLRPSESSMPPKMEDPEGQRVSNDKNKGTRIDDPENRVDGP
jgi:hypothetical protein